MGYIAKGSITLDTVNDAYTVAMTVPSCMIHADFDGSNPQLDNACTYITVLRGDKIMPFNCTSLLSGNEQIGISLTNTNRTTYLLKITSIPNNTLQGSVPLSITTDDGYITQVSFSYTVVRESTMLDWIQDWEGGKTKIGSTYIKTPKLFIGKKDQFAQYGPTGSNPKNDIMSVPGLTGVYIGPDQSSTGIYGYKNSVEIFHLNSQGGMIGGWDINNGGIQSKDGFLRILSDGHITATNSSGATIWELDSSGNAKFANGNITFNSDGSAKYKGRIESSEGKIGGWEINNLALYSTQVGVNSVNKYLAIANIQSIPTNNGTWDGNHLSWVRAYGGVAMYYTSNSDFGFIAYKGTSKTFSAGASNYIAGWNFDGDAMWLGTKNNALGVFTASSGSITFGTNGIRGYKWRIDGNGKAAFSGGEVIFNENDGSIFGWLLSSYRISTAHAALVSHSSYGGLFLSAQDISGVSVTSLASTIQNSGGIFMYANSSKSTLVSYNSDGTSTFCLSSNGSNYIAGWNFDGDAMWLGTKNNALGVFTASSGSITFGTNGIRGYKWRIDGNGKAAFSGGEVIFNENDGSIFGWLLSSYRISTAHAALVSHSSYGGLFLSAQDISGVSVTSLASTIQNSGGIFMYANSSKSTLVSYNSDGTSTFCLSSNGSNYIAGWNFDKECLYLGTKVNTSNSYTGSHNITIGSNGIRGYKWRLESDGSGAFAGGNIKWDTSGNVTVNGSITATSGSIGGFTIGSNRIGTTATSSGSGGSLAIYDNFLRVGATNGYAMFGDDVIPSSAGGAFTAAGRIVNTHPNTYGNYGFDQANYGLFISVSGGTKNYGISSNAALMAPAFINTKAKLLTFSGSTYSIDFSQNNIILLYYNNPNYSNIEVTLPTESSVARQFGLSSLPTDFAATVIFRVRTGSKRIILKGIYNQNEGTQDYAMEQGDSVMLLITKADGFRYQILNYTS